MYSCTHTHPLSPSHGCLAGSLPIVFISLPVSQSIFLSLSPTQYQSPPDLSFTLIYCSVSLSQSLSLIHTDSLHLSVWVSSASLSLLHCLFLPLSFLSQLLGVPPSPSLDHALSLALSHSLSLSLSFPLWGLKMTTTSLPHPSLE